jgi:hypothetical protein
MNFNVNKTIFNILHTISSKLNLYKFTSFSKVYDNGWWIKNDIKILVLGSSFAKCHIIPKVIQKLYPRYNDKEIANFAQSMGAPYEMYISLKKNEQYLKKLEYVYISIDPHILGEKFYHYMILEKQFSTYKQWEYLFNKNKDYMKSYHNQLRITSFSPITFFKDLFIKTYRKSSLYQGYEARRILGIKKFDEKKIKEYTYGDLKLFPVSTFSIRYLKEIQAFIQKNTNAKIIYFLSPSYDWQIGYENNCKEYDQQLINLLNDALGEVCIKGSLYKDSFLLNRFDFSDNRHLAHLGAVKYTKALFSDIANIHESKITPLYSYKLTYQINENTNIFNEYLELLKNDLLEFIADKQNIILYGFNNVSRVITALLSNEDIKLTISDNSPFLGSLSNFLEDNFIFKKSVLSINKVDEKKFDGVIATNFTKHKNDILFLENMKFSKHKIFELSSENIDYDYLHLQINLLFNLFDYIEKNSSNLTIIGNSIILTLVKERFKGIKITYMDVLNKKNNLDKNSIFIILNNFNNNKSILIDNFAIDFENIIYLDL